MERICVVKDVDDLILDWLDFLSRRRLSQVNWYYREKFRGENLPGRTPWQTQHNYGKAGNIKALHWMATAFPCLGWTYEPGSTIYEFPCSVFRWRQQVDPIPLSFKHLRSSLIYNKTDLAEYIYRRMEPGEMPIPWATLAKDITLFDGPTLRWLDEKMAEFSSDLVQMLLSRVHYCRDNSVWLWLKEKSVDLTPQRSIFVRSLLVDQLTWAEEHLSMNFSSNYEEIYRLGLKHSELPLVDWVLQRGYLPPPLPRQLSPTELQALAYLHFHHHHHHR